MSLYAKYYAILVLCVLFGVSFNMPQDILPDSQSTILGESMSPFGVRRTETRIVNGLYGGDSEREDLPYMQQPMDGALSYRRKRDLFGYPVMGMGGLNSLYGGDPEGEDLPYMQQPIDGTLSYRRKRDLFGYPAMGMGGLNSLYGGDREGEDLPYMQQPMDDTLSYRRKRDMFGYPVMGMGGLPIVPVYNPLVPYARKKRSD